MRRALSLAAARALATSSPKSDRCQQVAGLHLTSTNPWQQITADLAWPWGASHNREASWQGGRASSSAAVPSAPSFGGGQRETLDVLARAQIQPLLRPQLTDDEHPLGEGYNAWPFNVRAYYVGRDLQKMLTRLRGSVGGDSFAEAWSRESPLICLAPGVKLNDTDAETGLPCETYIAAFDRMQSIVFVNAVGNEVAIWKELTGGQLSDKFFEDYRVNVVPELEEAIVHQDDCLILEQANLNNLRTVAHVLAQTVALHFYETQVDHMLRKFEDMNLQMERTGSFKPATAKEALLQMVARNNLLLSDIILKLGISERFDAAWKDADCNKVFEELRDNLELQQRYENLQTKLNLIQENFRYVLELMQHQKSDLLEWTIIVLIGAEIALSLYELFFH